MFLLCWHLEQVVVLVLVLVLAVVVVVVVVVVVAVVVVVEMAAAAFFSWDGGCSFQSLAEKICSDAWLDLGVS